MSYMINSAKTILSCSRQFAQSTQTSKATNVTKPSQYIVKHLKTIPLGLLPYINSGPKKKKSKHHQRALDKLKENIQVLSSLLWSIKSLTVLKSNVPLI